MGSAALPLLCLPVYAVTMPAGAVASRGLAMQQQPLPPLWHPPPPVWSAAARSRPLLASSSVAVSAAGGAADDPGASVASSVMGLAKNIIGAGVLALSAGIASFSSAPSAAIVGIILLYSLGAISAYTFSLLGRLSERVRGESYVETFAHIFGTRTALIPAATITFMTGSAALMYAIILGELFSSVASLVGAPPMLCRGSSWILLLGPTVLLPLSLMRDLSALAFGAGVGTAGTVYASAFMMLRLLDGSYAPGGRFHAAIAPSLRPHVAAASTPILNVNAFLLVSMLATNYVAHYNAPKFYHELATPADGSSKTRRFNLVVALGFGIAGTLCAIIMAAGFLTFGANSQGLILNNYAPHDHLALICRISIGVSILFSFPINFLALRTGVLGLFPPPTPAALPAANPPAATPAATAPSYSHLGATTALLSAIMGASLVVKDLGRVVALGGALMGSALVYVYPALMFVECVRQRQAAGEKLEPRLLAEAKINQLIAFFGATLGVIGAAVSLR